MQMLANAVHLKSQNLFIAPSNKNCHTIYFSLAKYTLIQIKEIEKMHRKVISRHCHVMSSQFKPVQRITKPPTFLAG